MGRVKECVCYMLGDECMMGLSGGSIMTHSLRLCSHAWGHGYHRLARPTGRVGGLWQLGHLLGPSKQHVNKVAE